MQDNSLSQARKNDARSLSTRIYRALGMLLSVSVMLLALAHTAKAADYTLDANNQNWTTGTNWNPDGIPMSGDSIQIGGATNNAVIVTTHQAFGSGSLASNITGPTNPFISIAAGQKLTHVGGSTLYVTIPAANYFQLSGPGTFVNQGTIRNQSARFLVGYPTNNLTIQNTGTFDFATNGAGLELITNGGKFINLPGGNVSVSLGASTEVARIFGGADVSGQFLQSGGNPIIFNQGTLVFAPPGGIGGALDDTAFAGLFGPINGSSSLRLSGGLSSIALSNSTDLTRVTLSDTSNVLRAVVGGTTINVTNTNGLKFSSGVAQVVIPFGRTMTNVSGSKLITTTASPYTAISESGTFINQGIFQDENRFILGYPVGGTTFENQGSYQFTQNGAQLEFLQSNATFKNLPGGTVSVNLPAAGNVARIYSSLLDNNGLYQNNGGSPISFVQGTLVFAPWTVTGGTLNDAEFANLFGPINASSSMQLGGAYSINLTGATDVTRVSLGGVGIPYRAQLGGTTISATGPNGLKFTHTGSIDIANGRTITNLAGSTLVNIAGQENYFGGAGTFLNEGTIKVGNRLLIGYATGDTELKNNGVIQYTNNGAFVELYHSNAGGTFFDGTNFTNQTDGKLDITLPNATDLARIYRNPGSAAAVSFRNQGTIEVNKGIFRVEADVPVSSWTANTLNEGTYRVIANGNNSTLDLRASGTAAGSLTTIGANAKVVLSSTGANVATFTQLGSITNLQGELYVHGTKVQNVGASPLNVTGTLGGDGTINPTDSVVFNGGILDPSSLSGGPGTLVINGDLVLGSTTQLNYSLGTPNIIGGGVNDLVTVFGDLTLDGSLEIDKLANFGPGSYRLFNYTGTLTDNGVQLASSLYFLDLNTFGQVNLTVLPVPEPSTGLLLLVGLVGLRRRKRS